MLASSRRNVALALGMAVGCTGEIEQDLPDGVTPAQEAARKAWVSGAQPTLDKNCASCHGGTRPEVAWLEGGPDVNAQKQDLLSYPKMIVNLLSPQTSDLIKHGAHEGPALTAEQVSLVLDWIQKEREASPSSSGFAVMLPAAAVMLCTTGTPGSPTCPYNAVPLDGAGAAGAKFEFTATNAAGALYLSNLKIVPGPSGVYVDHPIFVSVPATGAPKLDPLDRYQGMKFNLGAGAAAPMQTLGNGTASFPAFSATDPLAIYAREVGAMKP